MDPIAFVCPSCSAHPALVRLEDQLSCDQCLQKWHVHDGVWSFTPDQYWGELPQAEMLALLDSIERDGFDAAMAGLQKREPGVFQFAMDPARADWSFGMELKPTDRVLDVGCGMGGNTFGLADRVQEVVAFDLAWARARFVQLRAAAEGKKNITVFAGDFMELPLPENTFDVIVFNGILEWIGQSLKFADPYEVQRWVMARCFRLLKPGGRMYVGIENRFSFSYLTGTPDHIGLRFTSWMPRWLARPYTKFRLKKDYRTYTHGKNGYTKLFNDAGFEKVRVLMPYPGYNDQRLLIPFDDVRCLRYAITNLMGSLSWKKRLVKWLSAIPGVLEIYRYFFFSFNIYGVKPPASDQSPTYESRIKLHNGAGYRNPKVSFIQFEDGKPSLFLKTVRFPQDASVIERAHEALQRANTLGLSGIPQARSLERASRIAVSSESVVEGRALRRDDPTEISAALNWLEVFESKARTGEWTASDVLTVYERIRDGLYSQVAELRTTLDKTFAELRQAAGGESLKLPRVLAHGDLTPSNVLIGPDRKPRVIDWDRFGDIEVPLFDLLTFIERVAPKSANPFTAYEKTIESHAASLGIERRALPLLIFFSVVLTDWRKRERFFPWEPALWDRDLLGLLAATLEKAKVVFPW